MIYGYVRVSTYQQNIDRQYNELLDYGIDKENIYIDKESGKDFNRKNYLKLISIIKEDDLIVVKSIDRLGRNYEMIINEWRKITKEIRANIVVLDMPLLDTRNSNKLIGTFISDIVLQILSFVAENERINIKKRQKEGIENAKKKGIKFGRPKIIIDEEILHKLCTKEISIDNYGKKNSISKSTLYRKIKEYIKRASI